MATRLLSKDMTVTESPDKLQVIISIPATVAGSGNYSNIAYYVYQPFLRGEDYPSLVHVWNNNDDDIFDSL